jgi:thiamine-phosphate pyrophosphorylase
MASRGRQAEPRRPVPRLYLVTPRDPSGLAHLMVQALGAADIAVVLLRLPDAGEESQIDHIKTVAPAVQDKGVALLLDGHPHLVGRAGADGAHYVMFGEPGADGARPSFDAVSERIAWWAELFEVPCVGFAGTLDEVEPLAAAGADFVAIGECVFTDRRGCAVAIADAARRLEAAETVA